MTVDDRTRLDLHRKLDNMLGSKDADALMASLPPVNWQDVATKDDVAGETAVLRGEMQAMAAELRGEMQAMAAELRGEMLTMGAELRGEIAELRGEMHTMRAELRTEIVEGTNRQIRWLVTFAAAWSSLLLAAVRLLP